jgi:hypothetical protein
MDHKLLAPLILLCFGSKTDRVRVDLWDDAFERLQP